MHINSCFVPECGCKTERIHIPAADRCDAMCYFCQYKKNGNISGDPMPGHSLFIPFGADEIRDYLKKRLTLISDCKIVGVSGPGDILASMSQLKNLIDVLNESEFSDMDSCICTNGWHFDEAEQLLKTWRRLKYITVTINTIDRNEFELICGKRSNPDFYDRVIFAQKRLLKWAAEESITIKINTVFNDYNQESVLGLWNSLRENYPIAIFNLMLMDGVAETKEDRVFRNRRYKEILNKAEELGFVMKKNCRHCRSDSYGKW